MKFAGVLGDKVTLYQNNTQADVTVSLIQVTASNGTGGGIILSFVPKSAGAAEFYLTPKVFAPPPQSIWVWPGKPFTMAPGDSIVGSAGIANNFYCLID